MGYYQPISVTDILAGLTTDSVKWKGADIITPHGVLDFWSIPTNVALSPTPANKTLGNVVIPNITGVTMLHAFALLALGSIENRDAASINNLDGNQIIEVDKAAAGYITALHLENVSLPLNKYVAASNEGKITTGLSRVGSYDISSRVDFNATTNFRWTAAKATGNDMVIRDLQTGVRVIF